MAKSGPTPDPSKNEEPPPELRSMDCQEFINRLKIMRDESRVSGTSAERRFAFFLGAGCSVSSGIPSAGTLVRDHWIPRLCKVQHPERRDYEAFARETFEGYEPENAAACYGQLIDALFVTPNQRQGEIERWCEDKFPGFGYAALAKLVADKSTTFNVVLTTNFDDLMADALYLYTPARPLVIHHESLAAYIRPTRMRPLIVKLHGDSRLSPKNTQAETESLNEDLCKHISMLLNDRGLIFMGYGGGDASIHKLLDDLPDEALPSGVFWLSRTVPEGAVSDWLRERDGVWVRITDFDEFMLRAYASFEMEHPSKAEFDKMFGSYYETFRKLGETIDKPKAGPPDAMLRGVLDAAREELPEDYKDIARGEALADSHPDEATRLLEVASTHPARSIPSRLAAARTLRDRLFKFDEAVVAFESALRDAIVAFGSPSEEAARIQAELAEVLWLLGDADGAARNIDDAIGWGEAQSPPDERLLSLWYTMRAKIRHYRGDLRGARADLDRCIQQAMSQPLPDDRFLAVLHDLRARVRREAADLEGAVLDNTRSIDWGEAQVPQDGQFMSVCYGTRASIRQVSGDLDGAEADIARCIEWAEAQSPRDDRSLAVLYDTRARIRHDRGDLDGAQCDITRSIEWADAQEPRDDRLLAIWLDTRARIRQDGGDLAGAKSDIQQSIESGENGDPHDGLVVAVSRHTRARIREELDARDQALVDADFALEWLQATRRDDHVRLAHVLRTKARILAGLNRWDDSERAIEASLEHHERAYGPDHQWVQKARAWQADIAAKRVPPRWHETEPR